MHAFKWKYFIFMGISGGVEWGRIVRLQAKPGRDMVVRKEQGLRGRRPSRRKEVCEAAGRGGVGLLLIRVLNANTGRLIVMYVCTELLN